jgi:UMF1 family MFS transporter
MDTQQHVNESAGRGQQRAWYQYDWASSAYPTPVLTVFLAVYLTGVAESAARSGGQSCLDESGLVSCDVSLLGIPFPAGSLWGYLLVLGTAVQLLALPVVGLVADRTARWSAVMLACVVMGAGGTAGLALVSAPDWLLGSLLFVIANAGFGGAQVIYNSYLPWIAASEERDAVVARGTGLGYLGAGIILVLQLVIYLGHDGIGLDEAQAVRLCFLISGVWWALFAIRPLRVLRRFDPINRPGRNVGHDSISLVSTARNMARHPVILRFLAAFFVYTAGINTVNAVASQYGEREIGLTQDALVPILVAVQFVGALGAWLHGKLALRLGTRNAILASLACWSGFICIGFFIPRGATFGYAALSCGVGLVMGGTIALSRSLFSKMVPAGQEARFFSLFSVFERASFMLGPLAFAAIGQLSGSYRPAMMSTLVFFIGGALLLWMMPSRVPAQAR